MTSTEQKMEVDEKPKFIVISGITSGLGRSMFLEFLRLGHVVAGFSRDNHKENEPSKLDKLKEEIKKITNLNSSFSSNIDSLIKKLDVTNEKEIVEWAKLIVSKVGSPPNLIIHNAGIGANVYSYLESSDVNKCLQILNINIIGFVVLAKAFTQNMKSQDKHKGLLIGMSSFHGQKGEPEIGPYVSSKFGLEGLMKSFHLELSEMYSDRLGCLCISPGFVNTNLTQGSFALNIKIKDENDNEVPLIPSSETWAKEACPWILNLNSSHSGKSLAPPIENKVMKNYVKQMSNYMPGLDVKDFIHPTS